MWFGKEEAECEGIEDMVNLAEQNSCFWSSIADKIYQGIYEVLRFVLQKKAN